ncbi:MAG: ParB/RepB/Spo0J family partition protein [Lachnospiraceae bacterium]|nr:ParB/RepB/Spo0J family partition protein [Lachnospiraceae bacterium]
MNLQDIKVSECNPFRDNPFKVRDDLAMDMLIQSIKENGVMYPILVRPQVGIGYEIISGHRRVYACKVLGIETIPAYVKQMNRDEAVIRMVDSNLQRDKLLPSEKAFAYKMKIEALNHQGKTSVQHGQKFSRTLVAEDAGESATTIQRYVRLTNLVKPLLDLVDDGKISLTPAVELSYLTEEEQLIVHETYQTDEVSPSLSQAQHMRRLSSEGKLTDDDILNILSQVKGNQREFIKIPTDRYERYLGSFHTPKEKVDFIMKALDHYVKYLERHRSDDAR